MTNNLIQKPFDILGRNKNNNILMRKQKMYNGEHF